MLFMTRWESRFKDHPLWEVLKEFETRLAALRRPTEANEAESYDRLTWLAIQLAEHRDTSDPNGYVINLLGNVQGSLQSQILNHLTDYEASPDTNQPSLNAAAESVDSLVEQMSSWPPLSPRGQAQAAGRLYSQFAANTEKAMASIQTRRADLETSLGVLTAQVQAEKETLERVREEFRESSKAETKAHLEKVTADYEAEISGSVGRIESFEKDARDHTTNIEELDKKSANIASAVAQRAIATNYGENARNKAVSGWIWDGIGVVVGGAPLVIMLIHFFQVSPDSQTTLPLSLTRLGISLGALGLATLCFQRGRSNHKESIRSKRAELRISTVEPFITNLHPEFQAALMEGMADRIYLQGILENTDGEPDDEFLKKAMARVISRNLPKEPNDDATAAV